MKLVIDYPIKYANLRYSDANFVLAPLLDTSTEYLHKIIIATDEKIPLMMDNGAWEFGKSMDVKRYIQLAELITPQWLVVPDCMKDADETFTLADEFFNNWINNPRIDPNTTIIFAPQGKNFQEMLECYNVVMDNWGGYIDMLGVPKHVGGWMNRIKFTNELYKKCNRKFRNVHFLGLWALEDFTPKKEGAWFLESIDTKAPFKIAANVNKWKSQMEYYHYEDRYSEDSIKFASYSIKKSMDTINKEV